jgi:hypothetical protein
VGSTPKKRARPSAELTAALHRAKAELHRRQADLSLRDKVRMVIALQRICLPLMARQRVQRPWEKPWEVEP